MYKHSNANPVPLLKKRKEKDDKDSVKQYIRKRNLILELLAQEVCKHSYIVREVAGILIASFSLSD